MKVLFLENNSLSFDNFARSLDIAGLGDDLEVICALPCDGATFATQVYDLLFCPVKALVTLQESLSSTNQDLPGYRVAIAEASETVDLGRCIEQGVADYILADAEGIYLQILPLTLKKILRAAMNQKRFSACKSRNQLLETVINQVPNKIFIKDWEGCYLFANQEIARFYNTMPVAMVGKRDTDFHLPTTTVEEFVRQNRQVIETHQELVIAEECDIDAEGQEHWYHWHKLPLEVPHQDTPAVLGIGTDITHYHQLLETLRDRSQWLSLALKAARAGVWDWVLETQQMTWSEDNFQLLGYAPETGAATYEHWLAAVHPDDRAWVETFLEQAITHRTNLEFEVRVQWPDGSIHWLRNVGQFVTGAAEPFTHLVGIQIDITEQKQAAERILFQASLLDQVRNAVIATDLHGKILYWNRYAEDLYQWTAAEVLGANVMEILVPQSNQFRSADILLTVRRQGYWEGEFEVCRKDGELLTIHVIDSLIRDEYGQPMGFVGISYDISDRKRLEAEQARQAYLLAGQREVLELMALGNPLAEILDHLVRTIENQWPGVVASILLLKDERLWHGAAPSLPETYQQAINGLLIGQQAGSCGTAAFLQEPIVVTDIATDPLWQDYRDLALEHGLRACWSVPIFSRTGEVLGTFAQYHPYPYRPTAQDWEVVNIAVKLAGLAIEQTHSDNALRESADRFQAIFEQAAVGMCQVSLAGQLLRVNQRMCELMGYACGELLTHTFQDLTHPDDLPANLVLYHQLIQGKRSSYSLEKRYIRGDRTVLWANLTVSLLRDRDGTPLYLIGVLEDITARKEAQREVQELVEGAAALTGQDFFPVLAEYLAIALGVRYVLISKGQEDTFSTYAFWANGQIQPNFSGSLINSPCRLVMEQGIYSCPQNLRASFPNHVLLQDLQAECYLGVRLHNLAGETIGSLCVMNNHPLADPQRAVNILRVFAARVGAELERQSALEALQDLNHTLENRVAARTAELQYQQAQLRQLSERLTLAVRAGDLGIWEYDCQRDRLIWDDRMLELYGLTAATFGGKVDDWEQRIHPEDLAGARVTAAKAIRGEAPYDTEFRVVHPNGEVRYIKAYAFHERQPDGTVIRAVGFNLDITTQKQTEAALRESETRYRLLMEEASDAILIADVAGYLLTVNQKAAALLGYSRQELQGMHISRIHPSERLPEATQHFNELLAHSSHQPVVNAVLRQDGSQVPVEVTATLIELNGQWVAQGIFRDISERLQIEREMHSLRERLQFLLSASPAIIYTCEPMGNFACTFISENVQRILGYSPEEWIAEPGFWVHRLHLDDRDRVLTELSPLFSQDHHNHEYRFLDQSGHYRWLRDELRLLRDDQGNPIEIVGYIADISDRKAAELALQQFNEDLECLVHQRTQELHDQATLLETILNSMADGVLVADQAGKIILRNPAAEQIARLNDPDDATPLTWFATWDIYLPNQTRCPASQIPLLRAVQGEAFDHMELILHQAGSPHSKYLEVSGRPLKSAADQSLGGVVVFRDVSDRKRSEEQLRYNSLHDSLTDLPNRDYLTYQLELGLHRGFTTPQRECFAVLFLDLDHFKVINDSLGHAVGDQVLVLVAQRLRSLIRSTDVAARLGGDEFVILLNHLTDAQTPVRLARQLLQEFQQPLAIGEREIFVSTSMGIVIGSPAYQAAADVLRDADIALYRAKAQGRNRYALFDEQMHIQALERLQMEHDLRNALANHELEVYYQPVIDLKKRVLRGFEALTRWHHATQGTISPSKFIPLAEETGLITPLDQWVLQTACQQLAIWRQQFPEYPDLSMSTNLVVKDLMRPGILQAIDAILLETGLPGQHLILEITESMLVEEIQSMASVLKQIQERGIRISIDDFGTGYSSLSYLHCLPVNAFKIDRSFVRHLEKRRKNAEIVKTIIALSNRLGLKVIAEGIETTAHLEYLKRLNCDMGQGYLFSAPLPAAAATQFITDFADQA